MKMEFKKRNEENNLYYEEFQACKKSWGRGAIFGVLAGIVCGLLFSGFEFNDIFFGMSAIMSISCTWTFATIFGLKYTDDFGLSCVPAWIIEVGLSIVSIFAGTFVLAWVSILLGGIVIGAWLLAFMFFALVFPLETLYYLIRYSIEKKSILSDYKATRMDEVITFDNENLAKCNFHDERVSIAGFNLEK